MFSTIVSSKASQGGMSSRNPTKLPELHVHVRKNISRLLGIGKQSHRREVPKVIRKIHQSWKGKTWCGENMLVLQTTEVWNVSTPSAWAKRSEATEQLAREFPAGISKGTFYEGRGTLSKGMLQHSRAENFHSILAWQHTITQCGCTEGAHHAGSTALHMQ